MKHAVLPHGSVLTRETYGRQDSQLPNVLILSVCDVHDRTASSPTYLYYLSVMFTTTNKQLSSVSVRDHAALAQDVYHVVHRLLVLAVSSTVLLRHPAD